MLIRDWLLAKGFIISHEVDISWEEIVHFGFFEKQYMKIAEAAVVFAPEKNYVGDKAKDSFESRFGIEWEDALSQGMVMNGVDSCLYLDISHSYMSDVWKGCIREGKVCKLGRGFYCAYIDVIPDKEPIFCINGFYMSMRNSYIAEGASVHVLVVEWNESMMSWKKFRRQVVGHTDPSTAIEDSLRRIIYNSWNDLGLTGEPDFQDNCVHGSASAFEALVEKANWLQRSISIDTLCLRLIEHHVPYSVIKKWAKNPIVKEKRVFDHMENKGTTACLEVFKNIFAIGEGNVAYLYFFTYNLNK